MDLATTPSWTVNCSILLTDLPLLDRPRAARAAGFDAVEFWWPFPAAVPGDRDVEGFVRAITDAGVTLSGLNLAGGDMAGGERGLLSDPARAAEFADNLDVAIDIGARLGAAGFNALYGNRVDGVPPDEQDELAATHLARAGRAAAAIGAVVLVEPVSGVPAYPVRTAADAVAVLDRVRDVHGVEALRLLADLYHLAVNGDDVDAAITAYADRIGHVQIADAPGRGAPGTGEVPLASHIEALARQGYAGRVALEYEATGPDAFAWLRSEAEPGS